MARPAFLSFAQSYLIALLTPSGTVSIDQMVPHDPNLRVSKVPSRTNADTVLLTELTQGLENVPD